MSNKKIYQSDEAAQVIAEKLSPTKNDVIHVRMPGDLDYDQMSLFAEQFQGIAAETGCCIIFTTDRVDIEVFNETEMNEQGWFRLHDGNPVKH